MYEPLCELLRTQFDANELPVDVYRIARGMGIEVITKSWRGRPHAACVIGKIENRKSQIEKPTTGSEDLRIIILNGRRPETARRFDLAHELGHFILRKSEIQNPKSEEMTGDRAQNRFAAALLLPRQRFEGAWVRGNFKHTPPAPPIAHGSAALQQGSDFMCELFGVSMWVVALRHRELREWRG